MLNGYTCSRATRQWCHMEPCSPAKTSRDAWTTTSAATISVCRNHLHVAPRGAPCTTTRVAASIAITPRDTAVPRRVSLPASAMLMLSSRRSLLVAGKDALTQAGSFRLEPAKMQMQAMIWCLNKIDAGTSCRLAAAAAASRPTISGANNIWND